MIQRLTLLSLAATLCVASCGSPKGDLTSSGADLYRRYGCSSCHGGTGSGGPLGPSLQGISQYWNQESLTDFLVDPKPAFASDKRLAELNDAFPNQDMRPFSEFTRDQLERIAGFVLSL